MPKMVFNKGILSGIKKSRFSPLQARRLKKAIVDINSSSIESLCKSGRVKKLQNHGQKNLYSYRVSSSERILFSATGEQTIVHDIVNTNNIKMK